MLLVAGSSGRGGGGPRARGRASATGVPVRSCVRRDARPGVQGAAQGTLSLHVARSCTFNSPSAHTCATATVEKAHRGSEPGGGSWDSLQLHHRLTRLGWVLGSQANLDGAVKLYLQGKGKLSPGEPSEDTGRVGDNTHCHGPRRAVVEQGAFGVTCGDLSFADGSSVAPPGDLTANEVFLLGNPPPPMLAGRKGGAARQSNAAMANRVKQFGAIMVRTMTCGCAEHTCLGVLLWPSAPLMWLPAPSTPSTPSTQHPVPQPCAQAAATRRAERRPQRTPPSWGVLRPAASSTFVSSSTPVTAATAALASTMLWHPSNLSPRRALSMTCQNPEPPWVAGRWGSRWRDRARR